jgi:hypothetical protein
MVELSVAVRGSATFSSQRVVGWGATGWRFCTGADFHQDDGGADGLGALDAWWGRVECCDDYF